MGIINVLDIEVANLIAAGEVVERPANAVKELVENSVDAGAHTVSVEIAGGGIRSLRVTDDGCGMSAEDAVVSVRRHATKIIIAQRIASVEDADRIFVLDGGRIYASGTHAELLSDCDIYREIYLSQNKGGDKDAENR